jgi:hypothetical protein
MKQIARSVTMEEMLLGPVRIVKRHALVRVSSSVHGLRPRERPHHQRRQRREFIIRASLHKRDNTPDTLHFAASFISLGPQRPAGGASRSFAAMLTRSASEPASILRITCPRCAFTVISLMPSS